MTIVIGFLIGWMFGSAFLTMVRARQAMVEGSIEVFRVLLDLAMYQGALAFTLLLILVRSKA